MSVKADDSTNKTQGLPAPTNYLSLILQEQRELHALDAVELARAAGVTLDDVINLENGSLDDVSTGAAMRIANAMGMTLAVRRKYRETMKATHEDYDEAFEAIVAKYRLMDCELANG